LSISNYKYNDDWLSRWCACGRQQACGKERLAEEERPAEKNEGDADPRSMRVLERRRSEEGTNIRGKAK
jgi:hypothetical protein